MAGWIVSAFLRSAWALKTPTPIPTPTQRELGCRYPKKKDTSASSPTLPPPFSSSTPETHLPAMGLRSASNAALTPDELFLSYREGRLTDALSTVSCPHQAMIQHALPHLRNFPPVLYFPFILTKASSFFFV
ncbi:hypothetical protein DFJ73DRAFT_807190 [Zopfochytrium polystomum]|nr:hypothetical protein DFJ73DRAFT_807190 [Zopfochytrium polystomum]